MNPTDLLTVVRDVNSPPGGGWKYTVPETGVTITDPFFIGIMPQIVKHLRANGIEVTDERLLQIEHDTCVQTNPPGWCRKREPKPVAGMPVPLLGAVETFLRCIWAAIVERKFVPRAEAERRMAICMKCNLRGTSPGGCTGCYTLLKKANALLERNGAFVIEPDEDGFVRDTCQACLCVLPLKVWLGDGTLNRCEGSKRPPYAQGCWRLENSTQ